MDTDRCSRRDFLRSTTALGVGVMAVGAAPRPASARPDTTLRVLSIGVVGTIGGTDRTQVHEHPRAEIVGLCDVDANALDLAARDHPDAFTCADYRDAFEKHGDAFDAVIVATPDHSHCSIMTLALARGKHVYGQKPLVQQLEELEILRQAVLARPALVTQTGAQRIESRARRAAVDLLGKGVLGKVIEVHVAFGGGALAGGHYFADGTLYDPIEPPDGFDYDLWLNGAEHEPCRPNMVQRRWRSWWRYGGGQIADWVVHLTDVLFYAFPELQSPDQVCSRTPSRDLSWFHADRVLSTLTYPVDGERFANTTCNFHFYDSSLKPDRAQLGIGQGEWPGDIFTVVVCEGGTMVLGPSGPLRGQEDRWPPDTRPARPRGVQSLARLGRQGTGPRHPPPVGTVPRRPPLHRGGPAGRQGRQVPRPGARLGPRKARVHQPRGSHEDDRQARVPRGLRAGPHGSVAGERVERITASLRLQITSR
ncbi:MAG: Gfo/Idh/MocA family protein [Planctomycetota bacterium]|jgi:predicted dehydrogenase